MTAGLDRKIERICVVRFGGMGDILLATPAVRALARHFQTSEIDFIVGRGMKAALEGIPYIASVSEFDKGGLDAHLSQFVPFLQRLHRRRYDLFVNFQPSAKTLLMSVASRAPRVITFRKDRRRQPDSGRVRHAVDDFTKELKPLGIEAVADRRLDFVVPEAARTEIRNRLAAARIAASDTLIVINASGTREINRWPADRFVMLINDLPQRVKGVRIVLSGGPGDLRLNQEIGNAVSRPIVDLAGQMTVKELGALLSLADVVVTGDTGPMHIASAVGAPLVVLSGAADPDRSGPLSPRDLVVINRDLSCVPCQGRTCKRGDIACMTQMPVEWVLRAIERRLQVGKAELQ